MKWQFWWWNIIINTELQTTRKYWWSPDIQSSGCVPFWWLIDRKMYRSSYDQTIMITVIQSCCSLLPFLLQSYISSPLTTVFSFSFVNFTRYCFYKSLISSIPLEYNAKISKNQKSNWIDQNVLSSSKLYERVIFVGQWIILFLKSNLPSYEQIWIQVPHETFWEWPTTQVLRLENSDFIYIDLSHIGRTYLLLYDIQLYILAMVLGNW